MNTENKIIKIDAETYSYMIQKISNLERDLDDLKSENEALKAIIMKRNSKHS